MFRNPLRVCVKVYFFNISKQPLAHYPHSRSVLCCSLSYWWTHGPWRPSVQSALNLEHLFTSGPGCSDLTHQPNSLFRARWQPDLSLSGALSTTSAETYARASQITLSMLTARPIGTAPGLGTATHRWPASGGSTSPSCQKTNCPTACTFMNSPPGLGCRKEVKENPWPTQLCDRNGFFYLKVEAF